MIRLPGNPVLFLIQIQEQVFFNDALILYIAISYFLEPFPLILFIHFTASNYITDTKPIPIFIGSINEIERVKEEVPVTILDKVKQKIELFVGNQSRFVYQNLDKKRITIQGLSGTGKTELLLHKLKDLYTGENSSSIYFTCHNKILADSLKKRIPSFFNFMKVEQQIEWENRLWCTNTWGSAVWMLNEFPAFANN